MKFSQAFKQIDQTSLNTDPELKGQFDSLGQLNEHHKFPLADSPASRRNVQREHKCPIASLCDKTCCVVWNHGNSNLVIVIIYMCQ